MGTYSQDLRDRILRAIEEGAGDQEVAKRYGVHRCTVWRYRTRYQESGESEARKQGGRRVAKLAGHEEVLRQWTEKNVNITLVQLAAKCREKLGIKLAPNTVWRRLKALGLSHKKKSAGGGAKPARR